MRFRARSTATVAAYSAESRTAVAVGFLVEVCGTAAIPPERCQRFHPRLLKLEQDFERLVEVAPLQRGETGIEMGQNPRAGLASFRVEMTHQREHRFLRDGPVPLR